MARGLSGGRPWARRACAPRPPRAGDHARRDRRGEAPAPNAARRRGPLGPTGVYGINAYGLPQDAPRARQGQAKQLKGYLLAFEQLMADFFAQLAQVKNLYSVSQSLRHTYFFQYLNPSVPNVEQ